MTAAPDLQVVANPVRRVLNVGGGMNRSIPTRYDGWVQDVLDIDPDFKPEICLDARDMRTLRPKQYDAVLCSHNLEHFYLHEVQGILAGFKNVLNDDGFVEIYVPNLAQLIAEMRSRSHDIMDVWYRTGEGNPITFHDVLFGWGAAMSAGKLFYAHKCGFTPTSMMGALAEAGFGSIWVADAGNNIHAFAYLKEGASCPSP